jgi:hypothetical protein
MGVAAHGPIVAAWYEAVGLVGVSRHDRFLWSCYSTNVLKRQKHLKAVVYQLQLMLRCRIIPLMAAR